MGGQPQSPDLLGIGTHCDFVGCNQLDFLPFSCSSCGSMFCGEHRTQAAHRCPNTAPAESTVVCPLCAKAIKLKSGDDANVVWEQHQRSGACDEANYRKVHNKARCPVSGCRNKLSTINTYVCKDCKTAVCLQHRFQSDHACRGAQSRPTPTSRMQKLRVGLGQAASFGQRQQPSQPTKLRAAVVSKQAPNQGGRERCPQCQNTFADIEELIAHVERAHQQDSAVQATDRCTVC